MRVGAELQAAGGILDRIDYKRVRRLGVQLRNIPKLGNDWDLPPSSLQGWIASFEASVDAVRVASEAGLLRLLQSSADEIHASLSREIIPAMDDAIADPKTLDELLKAAKDDDRVKHVDLEQWQARLPSDADLARIMVVQLGVSVTWNERPKVDTPTGMKRLKLGALIGQMALGGALAVGNIALGVVGGVITSIPGVMGAIPLTLGLVGSAYTGLNAVLTAADKIVDAVKS